MEVPPSTEGAQAVGVGKARRKPLPQKLDRKVEQEAGPAAGALRAVATSSAYGAPQRQLLPPERRSVSAAGLRGVTGGATSREITVLGMLLVAITVATLTVVFRRPRYQRRS
jgi:hypothetical protein